MCILKIFFVACMMLVASQAKEKSRCDIEHNITDADMEDLRKLKMSDKLNCFAKCALRATESVNNEGEINVEKLNQAINRWVKVTEAENAKLNECLGTIAPVKVCSDVKHIIECIKNKKAEEKSRCEIEHNITDADMEDLRKLKMSDKLNCFAKCALRATESMNNEGEINVEKLNQAINRWVKVTEAENVKLNECLGTIAPVKVCSDVKHIIECIKNRKV